jgi:hypothetical protein
VLPSAAIASEATRKAAATVPSAIREVNATG